MPLPHEAILGFRLFLSTRWCISPSLVAFGHSWYREMHQLVLRKSLTLELPHVEKIHLISIVSQWNPTTIVMVTTTPPGKSIIFLGTAADGTDTIHTRLRNISPFGISGAGFYLGQYHHYRKNKDTYCYSPSILPKKCQRHVFLIISTSNLT